SASTRRATVVCSTPSRREAADSEPARARARKYRTSPHSIRAGLHGSGADSPNSERNVTAACSASRNPGATMSPTTTRAIRLPDPVGFDTAAAVLVRGLTAHMLFERVRPLHPGDIVLIHAAAGGLGLIATQWAKRRGATVIGTVGDARKAALARGHGAD